MCMHNTFSVNFHYVFDVVSLFVKFRPVLLLQIENEIDNVIRICRCFFFSFFLFTSLLFCVAFQRCVSCHIPNINVILILLVQVDETHVHISQSANEIVKIYILVSFFIVWCAMGNAQCDNVNQQCFRNCGKFQLFNSLNATQLFHKSIVIHNVFIENNC